MSDEAWVEVSARMNQRPTALSTVAKVRDFIAAAESGHARSPDAWQVVQKGPPPSF